MEKKGLCKTCKKDKACSFPRKWPVFECEEFTDGGPKLKCRSKR